MAARLGGSPVWFVQRQAGSFSTEPVTREAHPYPLSDEGEQETSHPSSSSEPRRSGGSTPPVYTDFVMVVSTHPLMCVDTLPGGVDTLQLKLKIVNSSGHMAAWGSRESA
ncbi:hypothetical protein Taro_032164 [Colocasia esculenta]|uniref:Uncharacterized protein n=1 Tax=Colocasia esculenta TaxID=4460 RepID=A0A843VRY7_COLES|nr:hypothetical protein [Colocasia esculenta]